MIGATKSLSLSFSNEVHSCLPDPATMRRESGLRKRKEKGGMRALTVTIFLMQGHLCFFFSLGEATSNNKPAMHERKRRRGEKDEEAD